jgi:colanic acid biosynthesis glycosyl transferase WcaI
MHILFLTHYFPPEVNAPASRTYEHAKRWLREPDVQVTIVTNHPNHPTGKLFAGYRNAWLTIENLDGIRVRRVKTFLAANAAVFRRTANYLLFMVAAIAGSIGVRKPDVVVATSPQFFCAVAGYIVSLLKGKPFVFELRDIWPDSIVTVGAMRPSVVIRLLEKLELFLYRKATLVIAVTDSFRDNLIRRGIAPDRIVVVKNGGDLDFFNPRPRPLELAVRLGTEEKFVAAYIGTIGMAHAVETIVEAAVLLRNRDDILILVVGEGAHKAKVEELVASKRLRNIKVLPGVSKDEVRDYYALTDLNLVTLRKKPLFLTVIPSKIFEIMAMARPILSAVNGESRQILEAAGAADFAEPENPAEIADAIIRLRHNPEKLASMARNGRAYVEENYDRNRSAAKFLGYIKRLVADRHG